MALRIFQKIIPLVNILFALSFIVFPVMALAARTGCPTEGFVPCGTPGCPCQFCDLFLLFDKIYKFVMYDIVPPIAVVLLIVGGVWILLSGGNPAGATKGKTIVFSTLIGLAVVYGAYLLVSTFLMAIGANVWSGPGEGWFQYPTCN